jgi:hypothetical protein
MIYRLPAGLSGQRQAISGVTARNRPLFTKSRLNPVRHRIGLRR